MKECTVCLSANRTDYQLHCPQGLEHPNHCIDIVTDRLLEKLTAKGFGVVYHSFSVKHPKVNAETADLESEVKIELIFNKVYNSDVFESLGGSFRYFQSTYVPELLEGKSPNFILNFMHPKRSVLIYKCFYNAELVNVRQALVWLVEAICQWCDECIKAGEYNDGL